MAGLLSFVNPQQGERTLDYETREGFLDYLKRKVQEAFPYLQKQLAMSPQNQGGFLPPLAGTGAGLNQIDVDQHFKPLPQQGVNPQFMQGNFMQPQGIGSRVATGPGNWWQMKTSPNQTGEMVGPPPPGQIPPPQAQPEMQEQPPMTPPPQQEQAPQQPGGAPPFIMPQGQPQMTFQDYWKQMQEMRPAREKSWMEGPLYPLSMALMGMGQNLMTPPHARGYSNPMAPLMMAMQQQAAMKREDSPRSLYEKAVASYPHFMQATAKQNPNMHYIFDPESQQIVGAVPGAVTQMSREKPEKDTLFYAPGQGGVNQFYNLGKNRNVVVSPEARQKENPPQVVPILGDDGQMRFEPVPQGVKPTAPMRYQPSLMQQMQQGQQGGSVSGNRKVRLKSGEVITEEEAKRRGLQWMR